jgi:hypothetical protein
MECQDNEPAGTGKHGHIYGVCGRMRLSGALRHLHAADEHLWDDSYTSRVSSWCGE